MTNNVLFVPPPCCSSTRRLIGHRASSNDGTATRKRLSGVLVDVQVGHHSANGCTLLTRSSIVVAARKWVAGTPWNAAGSCLTEYQEAMDVLPSGNGWSVMAVLRRPDPRETRWGASVRTLRALPCSQNSSRSWFILEPGDRGRWWSPLLTDPPKCPLAALGDRHTTGGEGLPYCCTGQLRLTAVAIIPCCCKIYNYDYCLRPFIHHKLV